MRWIVLSHDNPARLHAHLESSNKQTGGVVADVVMTWSSEAHMLGYELLSQRIRARYHAPQKGEFADYVFGLVQQSRANGGPEQMTVFTEDHMLFLGQWGAQDAWVALQDPDVLGLSLVVGMASSARERRFYGSKSTMYEYLWTIPFKTGRVYRTSDLVGPMDGNDWDNAKGMFAAINGDQSFGRRPKMLCAAQPALGLLPLTDPDATQNYLRGKVIDLEAYRKDFTKYRWVEYRGD